MFYVSFLERVGWSRWCHVAVRSVLVHYRSFRVLLWLKENSVKLRKNETSELNNAGEGERISKNNGPDLVICTDEVKGHKSEPMYRIDAIREQDEPCLIETSWALSGLKGVERCGDDENEGKEEPCHETCINPYKIVLLDTLLLKPGNV